MDKIIKICYVDDGIEIFLSEYLDDFCSNYNESETGNYQLDYSETSFDISRDNYKTLLNNRDVNEANILIIDSNLFNDYEVGNQKLTGEKFKFILKYALPYIKTVVITQNDIKDDSMTLKKYRSQDKTKTATEHYDETLREKLLIHINQTIEDRNMYEQIMEDDGIDRQLSSSIDSAISGIVVETIFEKEDIDKLIEIFEEVKNTYGR